jgi:integrase
MRGRVFTRGNKNYIVFDIGKNPTTGRRQQKTMAVPGTKRDAEKKLRELLRELDTGSFINPVKVTLTTHLENWLRDYVWPQLAPRTAEGYEHTVRQHISSSFLGNIMLTDLKPEHLLRYYAEKAATGRRDGKGGLNLRSVRHHHEILYTALDRAVENGLIGLNPAKRVKAPRYQKTEQHYLDANGISRVLECAKDTHFYALYYTALSTGMRRSELLALRWSDVDLTLGQISVSRSLHHLRTGEMVYRQPKSAKGSRLIPLPPSLSLELKAHKEAQTDMFLNMGRLLREDDLAFSRLIKDVKSMQFITAPLLPDTVTATWAKIVKRAGCPGVRFHDIRHSHASLLLSQGVHPKIVQERLGHSSIQITLDTYSHIMPGLQRAAAEGFDVLIKKTPNESIKETR